MHDDNKLSRRRFLQSSAAASAATTIRALAPVLAAITESACSARNDAEPYKVLTETEAGTIAAIAARLIPTTDTPGASEAGVIYFIDLAFADALRPRLEIARSGLAGFNSALATARPGAQSFDGLDDADQDAFLQTQEGTDFFELMRFLTIAGFFAMESYGGNRSAVAWQLIGFEGHHGAWQYPFGYYDAEAAGTTSDG